MISFDTFSGPRGRVREAELDPQGLLVLAEHPTPAPQLFPAIDESPEASDSDDSEFYESQDDSEDSSDLFHEHDDAEPAQDAGHDQEDAHDAGRDQEHASGGRIRRVVELLTLQSHNVRSALVDKLLGVVKVHELLLTRATEEQIANAANDAITDEILESVDQEERRRSELALKEQPLVPLQPVAVAAPTSTLFGPGHLSPFRVLELVDVLDSTTGGMVKRVLTNVRRRAPLNGRMMRDNEMERDVEFCRFCSAYGDHTAAQHRSSVPLVLDEGRSSGVYVLSYAEGSSVVPARILKYMRLLMHHEVPTNAFSVVVRFDPRPSHWELMKPGMVSPRSLPSSPSLSHQLQKRMAHYTLQTLLGARDKLRELESTRHKLQHRQQQIQAQLRSQEQDQQHLRPGDNEERQVVVPVDA
ncbi:uncharacterized protein KRP23_13549 [Phytophthora ramorum]|uniref:uncharacterized protein n=1 Tax=Phytophthora ramorum TaxID=164328 RepID=UPI00309AA7EE|nr:hypothetical protein KRP23_13549 [Phytophthora ramorum]